MRSTEEVNSSRHGPEFDAAKERANQAVIEAEKFRASLNPVPGMEFEVPRWQTTQMQSVCNNVELSDDKFFHLTCHIDATLQAKIE